MVIIVKFIKGHHTSNYDERAKIVTQCLRFVTYSISKRFIESAVLKGVFSRCNVLLIGRTLLSDILCSQGGV
jgi:hypothetical protein